MYRRDARLAHWTLVVRSKRHSRSTGIWFPAGVRVTVTRAGSSCSYWREKLYDNFGRVAFGRLWYGEPNAVSNAIGYLINVYDDAGNLIEAHEHAGEFKEF